MCEAKQMTWLVVKVALILIYFAKWISIDSSKNNNNNNYKRNNNYRNKNKRHKTLSFCLFAFRSCPAAILVICMASKITITCPWKRLLFLNSPTPPLKVGRTHQIKNQKRKRNEVKANCSESIKILWNRKSKSKWIQK